jgi:outer membrane protein OmpA-like peptidoglycan-associated protein
MKKRFLKFGICFIVLVLISACFSRNLVIKSTNCDNGCCVEPVPEPEPVVKEYVMEEVVIHPITVNTKINFDYDSAVINNTEFSKLNDICQDMNIQDDLLLIIEGYASEEGTNEYNLNLSNERAKAVKYFLVSLGLNENRIKIVVGNGETSQFGQELEKNRVVLAYSE